MTTRIVENQLKDLLGLASSDKNEVNGEPSMKEDVSDAGESEIARWKK